MKRTWILLTTAVTFSLLVTVQGYFALHEDAGKELRADRIGATIIDIGERVSEAGADVAGLSGFVTLETEDGRPHDAILLKNGKLAGDFAKAVITLRVADGDRLALRGGDGNAFIVSDYPDGIDSEALPFRVVAAETTTDWGVVAFR